jgi:hypothetical protein
MLGLQPAVLVSSNSMIRFGFSAPGDCDREGGGDATTADGGDCCCSNRAFRAEKEKGISSGELDIYCYFLLAQDVCCPAGAVG